MKVQVTLEFNSNQEAATALLKLEGLAIEKVEKKEKTKPAPETEAPATEEADLGFDPEPETKPAGKITEEDVVNAARAHAKKHQRANTAKVLEKLGVKSVREIKPENYEKAIKALAV